MTRRAQQSGTKEESFSEVVRELHDRLYALAVAITTERTSAEDALAAAYAAAWSRHRAVRIDQLDHYLWRAVARQARRQAFLRRRPLPFSPPAASKDPADGVADADHLAYLLARLPAPQRAVVALRYVADLPEADVARVLSIAPGTVKSRLARAARTLRAQAGRASL